MFDFSAVDGQIIGFSMFLLGSNFYVSSFLLKFTC